MNFLAVDIYSYAVLFILVHYGETLRCRSGNQQIDDQVHKIMLKCRKKDFGNENKSSKDYTMSRENESSEEDSDSPISVDDELFFRNSNKGSFTNNSRNGNNYGQSYNDNYGEHKQNDKRKQESSGTRSYYSNSTNYSSMNNRDNGMSNMNERWNNRNGMQLQNRNNNNYDRRNQSECISQCFFDELNLVDHRGFPERKSVIEIMTRGIQDPNVRDFIEESISECFRYLDLNMNNRDNCSFSSHLMSCFADKSKERCEDWDDK